MAVSYVFRQSFRPRSGRFSRRLNVVFFGVALAAVLAEGSKPLEAHTLGVRTMSCLLLLIFLFPGKSSIRNGIMVTSLDDRAMLKYGAEYEALNPEQQKDILDHYRVGNYIFPRPPEQESPKLSNKHYRQQAFRIYLWSALPVALLYGAGWHWLPSGYVRAAWTNVPVIAAVLLIAVLALPTLLKRWNDPA